MDETKKILSNGFHDANAYVDTPDQYLGMSKSEFEAGVSALEGCIELSLQHNVIRDGTSISNAIKGISRNIGNRQTDII